MQLYDVTQMPSNGVDVYGYLINRLTTRNVSGKINYLKSWHKECSISMDFDIGVIIGLLKQ